MINQPKLSALALEVAQHISDLEKKGALGGNKPITITVMPKGARPSTDAEYPGEGQIDPNEAIEIEASDVPEDKIGVAAPEPVDEEDNPMLAAVMRKVVVPVKPEPLRAK
jgi:hypothetical protein